MGHFGGNRLSLLHWILPPGWPCLMGMDVFRPWADIPRLSRFLLNSESANFVTQSIKIISWGSKIAAYIFCECHRKFYRVLCKGPRRDLRLLFLSWGTAGGGVGGAFASPKYRCYPSDTGGTQCAYSLVGAVTSGGFSSSAVPSSHLRSQLW